MRKYKKLELVDDKVFNLFRKIMDDKPKDEYEKFVSEIDSHIYSEDMLANEENEAEVKMCDDFFTDFVCAISKERIPLVVVANVVMRRMTEVVYYSADDKRGALGFLKDLFEFQLKEVLEQENTDG